MSLCCEFVGSTGCMNAMGTVPLNAHKLSLLVAIMSTRTQLSLFRTDCPTPLWVQEHKTLAIANRSRTLRTWGSNSSSCHTDMCMLTANTRGGTNFCCIGLCTEEARWHRWRAASGMSF